MIKTVTSWSLTALMCMLAILSSTLSAQADEMRPGLLDIKERVNGWYDVTWKVPLNKNNTPLAINLQLPDTLTLLGNPTLQRAPAAVIETATYKGDGQSLAGKQITIAGLQGEQTDILLRIELQDGSTHSSVIRPSAPTFTIPARASKLEVASAYWQMGTVHILLSLIHI